MIEIYEIKEEPKSNNVFDARKKTNKIRLRVKDTVMVMKNLSEGYTATNFCGVLTKGSVCTAVSEINFAKAKMYKLDSGRYILADNKVEKI